MSTEAKRLKLDDEDDNKAKDGTTFPDEVLLKMFTFLPFSDVVRRLPLVCKRFRTISLDPSLWKKLSLNRWVGVNYCPTDKTLEILKRCTLLTDLTIRNGSTDSNELAICAINTSNSLTRLTLQECQPISADLLKTMSEKKTSATTTKDQQDNCRHKSETTGLRRLVLHKTGFAPGAMQSHGHGLNRLTSVDLCGSSNDYGEEDEDEETETLNNEVAFAVGINCHSLESCKIWKGVIGPEAFDRMILGSCSTVKTLHLCYGQYPATFHKFLPLCQQLDDLYIPSAYFVDGHGLNSIAQIPKLRVLFLDDIRNLRTADFVAAFRGKKLENLQELTLNRLPELGDALLNALAEACPNLVDLALMRDRMDDDVAEPCDDGVRSLLRNCRKLKRLKFNECGVSWDPLFELVPSMQRELEYLRLYDCENIWKDRDDEERATGNARELVRLAAPGLKVRLTQGGEVFCREEQS